MPKLLYAAAQQRLGAYIAFALSNSKESGMSDYINPVETALKAASSAFTGYDEAAVAGKDNLAALMTSGNVLAKGFETMAKSWMAFNQKAMESGIGAAKEVFGVKNLNDLVEWQGQFARQSFDALFDETSKLSEIGVKTAQEAFGPITERFNVAVEAMLKQPAA
jgi:phasin family protein